MKRFRRFLTGIMVALGVFSVGSIASAEEFMDLTPLFGNVNVAVPGVEVIMPLIQENDANKDKYSESVTFYFRVFRNNTTTLLYNTTPKVAPYPARTCTVPMSFDSWVEPTFVRSGKWMVMGSNLQMWCSSSTGRKENSNTFVYVADVSKAAGVVWTMVVNSHELFSAKLSDYNGDGKLDLVVVMKNLSIVTGGYLRTIVKNLDTWATISDKTYYVSNDL